MIPLPTNFTDPSYFNQLTLWHNQQNEDAANQKSHDEYLTNYNNWMEQAQQLQAYGKPLPLVTAPPMKITYNDDGSITSEPFPDLHPEILPPLPNPVQTVSGLSSTAAPAQMTIDQKLDTIIILLNIIVGKSK